MIILRNIYTLHEASDILMADILLFWSPKEKHFMFSLPN